MKNVKRYGLSVLILLVSCSFVDAQISDITLQTKTPAVYEKTDWLITLKAKWDNPYLEQDVALNMDITSPSGTHLVLPCYYESGGSDGTSRWKARFMPQETGRYSCHFVLTEAAEVVSTSPEKIFSVKSGGGHGILHPGSDWIFRFDDGTPFRGIGENIGWESRTFDDSKFNKTLNENPKYNYGYMLPSLASHGGNFFRTWICRWNLPIDWKHGFNNTRYDSSSAYYNPSAVKRMDWMIHLADSLGLHIMLTLGPGAYSIRDGGLDTSAAEFFSDPASMTRYKNRLRYIIARWGYSPAIGAWELFNEVDNVMYRDPRNPIDHVSIVRWHDSMSTYLKKTDPYHHLVTTSISHRDLPGLDTLANIDFNQKHIYRNTRSIPATILSYEKRFSKPYVIGEFSYEWDWSKDFNSFKDGMISDFKRGLWYGLFSPTPILPMSWWWEYFDSLGTDAYISHVRMMSELMLKAGHGTFDTLGVKTDHTDLVTYGVQCGTEVFVYAYNPTKGSMKGIITLPGKGSKNTSLRQFDCESGKFIGKAEIKAGAEGLVIQADLPAMMDRIYIIGGLR